MMMIMGNNQEYVLEKEGGGGYRKFGKEVKETHESISKIIQHIIVVYI